MEAISRGCRKKDKTQHHCDGNVRQEQPKRLKRCTCPCHFKTEEARQKAIEENEEWERLGQQNAFQGCNRYRYGRR